MSFKAPSAFALKLSRAFRDEGQVNGSVFSFIGVRYEDTMNREYFQMCITFVVNFRYMLLLFIYNSFSAS